MEILRLTATQFLQPMGTGRTRPILVGAEGADGKLVEVVVKLRGPELGAKAQIAELVSAPLADLLGIDVPQAAVVDVPAGFEAIVPPSRAAAVKASSGRNFGSVHLGTSFTTWALGLDLGPFENELADLSDGAIEGLLEPVPAGWRAGHDLCERTAEYLREAREEKTTFLNFVRHILR